MAETYCTYVDGEWIESSTGETFEVRNPAGIDDVVGEFQESTVEDAERAVKVAAGVQEEWANTPSPSRDTVPNETARRLEERKEELADTLTREEGKTLSESRPEVQWAIPLPRPRRRPPP